MTDSFMKGASSRRDVGTKTEGGEIAIGDEVISGSKFNVKKVGEGGVLNRYGFIDVGQLNATSGMSRGAGGNGALHLIIADEDYRTRERDWRQSGPGITGGRSSRYLKSTKTPIINGAIEGEVRIEGKSFDLSLPDNQPPNVKCRWIMRVE